MPTNCEQVLSFVIGGELIDTKATDFDSRHVYEGKTRPGVRSQLLKMSMTLESDLFETNKFGLEFIDEQKKSLLLRDEIIEFYSSIAEIGYEHYLIVLAWGADLVIVKDWNVYKRIVA